jgi:hypothetical protein
MLNSPRCGLPSIRLGAGPLMSLSRAGDMGGVGFGLVAEASTAGLRPHARCFFGIETPNPPRRVSLVPAPPRRRLFGRSWIATRATLDPKKLTTLDVETATELARRDAKSLMLDSLLSPDAPCAEKLAAWKGPNFHLGALPRLEIAVAERLAAFRGPASPSTASGCWS